jgi:hypothetical protein
MSDSKTSPAALEWLEVAEISSPIDIRSARTDLLMCESEAGLATAGKSLGEERCVTNGRFSGFCGWRRAEISVLSVNALILLYRSSLKQPDLIQPRLSMATAVISV